MPELAGGRCCGQDAALLLQVRQHAAAGLRRLELLQRRPHLLNEALDLSRVLKRGATSVLVHFCYILLHFTKLKTPSNTPRRI